jgi:tRNA-dihydrouridine synthase A
MMKGVVQLLLLLYLDVPRKLNAKIAKSYSFSCLVAVCCIMWVGRLTHSQFNVPARAPEKVKTTHFFDIDHGDDWPDLGDGRSRSKQSLNKKHMIPTSNTRRSRICSFRRSSISRALHLHPSCLLPLAFVLMSCTAVTATTLAFQYTLRANKLLKPSRPSRFCSTQPTNQDIHDAKYQQLMGATKLSLAPMMEYTDRHFRHVVRLISKRTLLYTEMVAGNSLMHEREGSMGAYRLEHPEATDGQVQQSYSGLYIQRSLGQAPLEGPCVLQLGGSDPQQLFRAAQTVMDMTARGMCDYTALNLNCGCPSPKVAGKGCFGAALMDDAELVAELTKALHDGTEGKLPITVKCRIGTDVGMEESFTAKRYETLDAEEEYRKLRRFIETVASNGIVTDFSVHARIAVLQKSFSPADNRKIPPLKYDFVHRLARDYPDLTFSLNGGLESISQAQAQFDASPSLAGVMIGRAWAADPWSFAMADRLLYGDDSHSPVNRLELLKAYGKHADAEEELWDPVKIRRFIVKAVSPLFAGEANGKKYRIAIDEIAGLPKKLLAQGKTLEGYPPISELIVNAALEHLSEETLLRTPEESYDRVLFEEAKRNGEGRSLNVAEWQERRKQEDADSGTDYLTRSTADRVTK